MTGEYEMERKDSSIKNPLLKEEGKVSTGLPQVRAAGVLVTRPKKSQSSTCLRVGFYIQQGSKELYCKAWDAVATEILALEELVVGVTNLVLSGELKTGQFVVDRVISVVTPEARSETAREH